VIGSLSLTSLDYHAHRFYEFRRIIKLYLNDSLLLKQRKGLKKERKSSKMKKMNMKIFNAEQRKNIEIHELLQEIKYEADKQTSGIGAFFDIMTGVVDNIEYNSKTIGKTACLRELEKWGVIEIIDADNERINKTIEEDRTSKNKTFIKTGYFVKPIEPKFSELCEKYEKIYHEIEDGVVEEKTSGNKLQYVTKENVCYIKTQDKEIKIGKVTTRKCKLLKCLFEPIGTAKTIDTVFGDIQMSKDANNQRLWDGYLGKRIKISIIRTTGKEIQRIFSKNKIKTKIIFHIKDKMIWMEII
jgi:hypothetical protein